jgi:hypothetical protein
LSRADTSAIDATTVTNRRTAHHEGDSAGSACRPFTNLLASLGRRREELAMRFLFAGLILMSISLGMLLSLVLDNWLRGGAYVWWLLLALLMSFAILSVSITVLTRLRCSPN